MKNSALFTETGRFILKTSQFLLQNQFTFC